MKKKIISMLTVLALTITLIPQNVYAGEKNNPPKPKVYEEGAYQYKIVWSKWSKPQATGWKVAGGQGSKGVSFKTGKGSLSWSDNNGGPKVNMSFNLGASVGYGPFSVSIPIGTKVSSGSSKSVTASVTIPGKAKDIKKNRYKLAVKKWKREMGVI